MESALARNTKRHRAFGPAGGRYANAHPITVDAFPFRPARLLIHWLTPTNKDAADSIKVAFLIEQRTLTLTIDEKNGEVGLQWDATFEVGPAWEKVKLTGTDYNGLGMRLPEGFDRIAQFQNSENAPYLGLGNERTRIVIPGEWSAVAGAVNDRPIMVALFASPANKSGNSFFSLLEPFAYLSATQALDQQPLEYKRGEKFKLTFLITAYSENKSREFLAHRYTDWKSAK